MNIKVAIPVVLSATLIVSGAVYVGLDIADVAPGILTTKSHPTPKPPPTLPKPPEVKPVAIADTSEGVTPGTSRVRALINDFVERGSENNTQIGVIVSGTSSGEVLGGYNQSLPLIPASNMKVPASVTALMTLGPQYRFKTETLLAGNAVILRAGGDMTLAADAGSPTAAVGRAGLQDLAAQTAQALEKEGHQVGKVIVDTSVWNGELTNSNWIAEDNFDFAGEITPLAIDRGRYPENAWHFYHDATLMAAQTFISHLRKQGVSVGEEPEFGTTPEEGEVKPLAKVESAPLSDITHYLLKHSDNTLAEAVCREAARAAGEPTNFAGAATLMVKTLTELGVDTQGYSPDDCSGLSYNSRVGVRTLQQLLNVIASGKHPELNTLASDLPIANLDGTLRNRLDNLEVPGSVTGKTGTLGDVRSLCGFAKTQSNYLLTYCLISNGPAAGGQVRLIDEFVGGLANL